jgi:lysine-specific demethylase 8
VRLEKWQGIAERARTEAAPLVIEDAYLNSAAVSAWTPREFARRFGNRQISVVVDLPDHGVPYLDDYAGHGARMRLDEFVARMERGERCYLSQARLEDYHGLVREIDLSALTVLPVFGVNLWLGNGTRSGLHFDTADNFLVQIYGHKSAILIDRRYTASLRPFPDTPSKSQLDLEEREGPASCLATIPNWRATIGPGDALYIPRGWWHYLATPEPSISVNAWNGARLQFKERCAAFLRAGPATWTRVSFDFLWSGVLGRPHRQRMFSPPPLGVDLYRRLRGGR